MSGAAIVAAAGGAAVAAGLGVLARGLFSPRSRLLGPVVYRGDPSGPPRVALTFDDGPHPRATPAILDRLAALRVPAAFFVIGAAAARHPELVERAHAEGHLVGSHSYSHHHLGTMRGRRYWDEELARTERLIESIVGRRPRLFRPPMGFRSPPLAAAVAGRGLVAVTWTRRALDGVAPRTSRIVARLGRARAGDVLAAHDGTGPRVRRDPAPTVAAIDPLIATLRDRGLTAVRLDELIGTSPYFDDGAPAEPGARDSGC